MRPRGRISMIPGSVGVPQQPLARWYGRRVPDTSGSNTYFGPPEEAKKNGGENSSGTPTYLYTNLPVGACRPYYRSNPRWDTPEQPGIVIFGPEHYQRRASER